MDANITQRIIDSVEVLHRSDAQGVGIVLMQTVEVLGQRFRCDIWADLQTRRIHHVDSTPVCATT